MLSFSCPTFRRCAVQCIATCIHRKATFVSCASFARSSNSDLNTVAFFGRVRRCVRAGMATASSVQLSAVALIALLSLLVAGPELADAKQCASAVDLVKLGEGHKLCTYPDTKGHPTICYGFNLDAAGAEGKIHSVGGDWQAVRSGGCLDESQCETLLKMELESAMVNEKSIFGETCQCVEAALTDMTYNLGASKLRGFAHMIAAIKDKNWAHAADEAIDSSWCRYARVSQIHTNKQCRVHNGDPCGHAGREDTCAPASCGRSSSTSSFRSSSSGSERGCAR